MASSGRYVAIRRAEAIDLVDALGTAPREVIDAPDLDDFALLGDSLWIARRGRIHRRRLDEPDDEPLELELHGSRISFLDNTASTNLALVLAGRTLVVSETDGALEAVDVSELAPEPDGFCLALSAARLAVVTDRKLEIRDRRRGVLVTGLLPGGGEVESGAVLFAGKAFCFVSRDESSAAIDVVQPSGTLVHRVEIEPPDHVAVASTRGVAVSVVGDRLIAIDLRFGRVVGEIHSPVVARAVAIDAGARYLVLAGQREGERRLAVLHIPYTDLFGGRSAIVTPAVAEGDARKDDDGEGRDLDEPRPERTEPQTRRPPRVEERAIPAGPLRALRPSIETPSLDRDFGDHRPYRDPSEHMEELLDLLTARAGLAICEAWDSGRLSPPDDGDHLFQTEVLALLGHRRGSAAELVSAIRERSVDLAAQIGARVRATVAAGAPLPLIGIAGQFDLDPIATQVLVAVAAPALRGEVSRLYGILANDPGRALCDPYLVETLLCTTSGMSRIQVKAALEPSAPLLRHGLIQRSPAGQRTGLFAPLTVDPVLLSRLQGLGLEVAPGSATAIITAKRSLEELTLPRALVCECVEALREPPRDGRPVRLVIAGRRGSGRTSLVAALAARADLPITLIDADRLPRADLAADLRAELQRAALRGTLPVVSGLGFVQSGDEQLDDRTRDVLRCHPGPLAIRTSPEHRPPLDPGYLQFTIPPLGEAQRLEFWRRALARRDLGASNLEQLASRFRVGPGTIESVIDDVVSRLSPDTLAGDVGERLDLAARQHIDSRLGALADKVKRLARWEQVALPNDLLDSIREFIGRVRHRRTVYETWGFEKRLSSSRGLTALFYGPPGTGKTMVAGLIARELGLDLYRVDLARITSKWIGETEKNLASIFDAAEDGQAIILFDEADSLFARRTEVKSSVDRYANLEVNYLLQRFDTFEGVAILTTNFEGAIDAAFKRRLSLRLSFPFPDQEMRIRLWAAHIPPEVPSAGDFDFEALARRYPMSGGYIRNCALRAAFLAAQEDTLLGHAHLERVIELEYHEMGKLSKTSRME